MTLDEFVVAQQPLIVREMCRIYWAYDLREESNRPKRISPFKISAGPDYRLSDKDNNIWVNYWAESEMGSAEEVLFHRRSGEQVINRARVLTNSDFNGRELARLSLRKQSALSLFPYQVQDDKSLPQSAYYGDWSPLVNAVFADKRFDGIAYRSNQDPQYICYAIFEDSITKISNLVKAGQYDYWNTTPLGDDEIFLFDLLTNYPDTEIERPI